MNKTQEKMPKGCMIAAILMIATLMWFVVVMPLIITGEIRGMSKRADVIVDSNHDGKVSVEEAIRAYKSAGLSGEEMLKKMDVICNTGEYHSGRPYQTRTERFLARYNQPRYSAQFQKWCMEKLVDSSNGLMNNRESLVKYLADTDRNGEVTIAEAAAAWRLTKAGKKEAPDNVYFYLFGQRYSRSRLKGLTFVFNPWASIRDSELDRYLKSERR